MNKNSVIWYLQRGRFDIASLEAFYDCFSPLFYVILGGAHLCLSIEFSLRSVHFVDLKYIACFCISLCNLLKDILLLSVQIVAAMFTFFYVDGDFLFQLVLDESSRLTSLVDAV